MYARIIKAFGIINRHCGANFLNKKDLSDSLRLASSMTGKLCSRNTKCLSRTLSYNPMLNGVSMLQWFFDEVKPDQREVRYWMKYFSRKANHRDIFAVIQIKEDVFLQEQKDQAEKHGKSKRSILETLALSFYFLQQNKMNVVVVIGSDDTNQADKKVVRDKIHEYIKTLVDKLESSGTKSMPMFDGSNIFFIDKNSQIKAVNRECLNWLVTHGIPVIGCIGEDNDGCLRPIHFDDSVYYLSISTQPLKVFRLNSYGGIMDENSQKVTTIFLPDKTKLLKFATRPWWCAETSVMFERAYELVKVLPKESSYVVTSANDVLTELLTQRGYGTMFKKVAPVKRYTSLDSTISADGKELRLMDVLHNLVNSAFEKPTLPGYWESLPLRFQAAYLTDDLKSCAIVMNFPTLPNVFYLDKFAVSKEERGNFNIEVLWQQLNHDYKSLFWRSRHDNIFNSWYEARCDGIVKLGYYHVFWYGMTTTDINEIVKECEDLPSSFHAIAR